jgi:hypothetical protein
MAIIINPYTIPQFIAGLISLALGIYAIYKNPKDKNTRLFFIMMLGVALWSMTPIIVQAQTEVDAALFWAKISNTGLFIILVTLFHFTSIYQRKKAVKFLKIAIAYVITIIMIVLLLGTNLFFTMAEDVLIDTDGSESTGTGTGDENFTEEQYFQLKTEEIEVFSFVDTNDDGLYTADSEDIEPLRYNNQIIVGEPGNQSIWMGLDESNNSKLVWYVDEDKDNKYTIGESLYLENGDGHQGLVFNYVMGSLYVVLIGFFFGVIIASMVGLFLFYRTIEEKSIKRSIIYLIGGLFVIIIFILSQSILAEWIPGVVLDSAISMVISIFFTIAVLKYNIVDIKLIIRKSMFYSTASLAVVGCFVMVEEGMEIIFSEFAFSGSILSGVIAAFVALILFSGIKKGLKNQIDNLFPSVRLLDKEYQNRMTAYQATIIAMLADGILSKKEEDAINILRDKLDIKAIDHDQMLKRIRFTRR